MPFPLTLIDETQLEITALSADSGFKAEVTEFGKARAANVAAQRANIAKSMAEGKAPSQEGVYNAQYVKAKGVQGYGGEHAPHQTIFKPSPPIDKR